MKYFHIVVIVVLIVGSLLFNSSSVAKQGLETNKTFSTSLKDITEKAGAGDASAQYSLGKMYLTGEGVDQNTSRAVELFTRSATQGNANAQYNLGVMYQNGEGVPKDPKKAFELISKSANQGFAWAEYTLATLYQNGIGVAQDSKTSLHWYTKAAENGHVKAQFILGLIYDYREKDEKKIKDKYQNALQKGILPPEYTSGWIYNTSDDLQQDKNKAIHYFTKSSEQGFVTAQLFLGWMHYCGIGTQANESAAYKWWKHAAEQGSKNAQQNIKILCSKSQDVCKSSSNDSKKSSEAVAQIDSDNQQRIDNEKLRIEEEMRQRLAMLQEDQRRTEEENRQAKAPENQNPSNEELRQRLAMIREDQRKTEEVKPASSQTNSQERNKEEKYNHIPVSEEGNYFILDKIVGVETEYRFVCVKAGNFSMGGNRFNEGPVHIESIKKDFFIMDTEVSEGHYYEYLISTGHKNISVPKNPDLPIVNISWNEAEKFAQWISKKFNHKFRLPTEAEWEFSAQKGSPPINDSFSATKTSKILLPARMASTDNLKIHGMIGNVWEWCSDCWRERYENNTNSVNCTNKVIRGGSWRDVSMSPSMRNGVDAESKADNIGFRLVLQDE